MTQPSPEPGPKAWEYALFVVLPALAVLFFGIRIIAGISRSLDWLGLVLDGIILVVGTRFVLAERREAKQSSADGVGSSGE
jgi:hypothetical protein